MFMKDVKHSSAEAKLCTSDEECARMLNYHIGYCEPNFWNGLSMCFCPAGFLHTVSSNNGEITCVPWGCAPSYPNCYYEDPNAH
ncbi:hypothetical protein TYRP_001587 [Tyrophagus putrescentiae]|nr:hypothetical protein TYRP_001587 [Tyrophagus putrescentiae]